MTPETTIRAALERSKAAIEVLSRFETLHEQKHATSNAGLCRAIDNALTALDRLVAERDDYAKRLGECTGALETQERVHNLEAAAEAKGWNAAIEAAEKAARRVRVGWQRIVNSPNTTAIGGACAASSVRAADEILKTIRALRKEPQPTKAPDATNP